MANLKNFNLKEFLLKIISFISVEPFVLCWFLPSCILIVAMENLNLEKACRVNLQMGDEVCQNMINKTINNINCAEVDTPEDASSNVSSQLFNLTKSVCFAETESQKLLSVVFAARAPISSIFPLIIVLFAGGWSDKKRIRKPLVLLPIVGELIGSIVLLFSSIFMDEIPMEIPALSERITPSIFGGQILMLMGVYSYLSESTAEENRTFRFGCFTVFLTLVPITSIPWSGVLFNVLGYTKLFSLCIIIYVLGILHIIFILKEVKKAPPKEKSEGVDNAAYENDNSKSVQNLNNDDKTVAEVTKKGFFREFFDPTLAKQLIEVVIKKRAGNLRHLVWIVLICNITFLASLGENDLTYLYTRLKLNWDGVQYSLHITYGTGLALIGTLLMVGVFSKFFGISDAMIGIISTICTLIAKPIYAFALTTFMFYAGTTVDLFVSTKAIAIKSIISKIIDADELGRMFSVLGILDSLVTFVFPTLYSFVYLHTVDFFIGAIYFLSEFFFLLTLIMFIIIYIMVKKTVTKEDPDSRDLEIVEKYKSNPDLYETTKM